MAGGLRLGELVRYVLLRKPYLLERGFRDWLLEPISKATISQRGLVRQNVAREEFQVTPLLQHPVKSCPRPHAIACEEVQRETRTTRRLRTALFLTVGEEEDTWRSQELVFFKSLNSCANHEPSLVRKRWTISEDLVAPSEAGALAVALILYRIK